MSKATWAKTTYINCCTSQNCMNNAVWTMTSGDVSSDYCDECREIIDPSPHHQFGTWYPIATAPKDEDVWLLGSVGGMIPFVMSWDEGDGVWFSFNRNYEDTVARHNGKPFVPIAWMPLPPPPQETE